MDEETVYIQDSQEPYHSVSIHKSADKEQVAVGEKLTYTLDYEVQGNTSQTVDVVVADLLPAEVSLSESGTSPDYLTHSLPGNRQIIGWLLEDVAVGTTGSFEIQVQVESMPEDATLHNLAGIGTNCSGAVSNPALCAELIELYDEYVGGELGSLDCQPGPSCPIGCEEYDFDSLDTPVNQAPFFELAVDKQAIQEQVMLGQNVDYTIDWSVSGNTTATQAVIVDSLPEGVSLVSVSGEYTTSSDEVIWQLGDLAAGSSGSLELTLKVEQMPADQSLLNSVLFSSQESQVVDEEMTTIMPQPDFNLNIEKTALEQVNPGDELNYTIEWSVSGNKTAFSTLVVDSLPQDVAFIEASQGGQYSSTNHEVVWQLGDIEPNDSGSLSLTVRVADDLLADEELVNQVEIKSGLKSAVDEAITLVSLTPYYELQINKTASQEEIYVSQELTYTIDWSIDGNLIAPGVVVSDRLPQNVSFMSASHDGIYNASQHEVVWHLGDIVPWSNQANGSFTIVVEVDEMPQGENMINQAILLSGSQESVDEVSTLVLPKEEKFFELSVDKSGPSEAELNDNIVWIIEWSVIGNTTATDVVLKDVLPAGVEFIGADGDYSYSTTTHSLVWQLGDIMPGLEDSGSFQVEVSTEGIPEGEQLTNTVVFNSGDNSVSDSASTQIAQEIQQGGNNGGGSSGGGGGGFVPREDVTLSYSYPELKQVGNNYSESVTILNSGNVVLTNVVVKLDLDEEYLSFISSNLDEQSIHQPSELVTWYIPALGAGDEVVIEFNISAEKQGADVLTVINFESDQLKDNVSGIETIEAASLPGASPVGPPAPTPVPSPMPTPTAPTTPSASNAQGAATSISPEVVVEESQPQGEVVVAPAETTQQCPTCPAEEDKNCSWWLWFLVVLLSLVSLVVYWFYVGREDIQEDEQGEYYILKGKFGWMLPVLLLAVIIFMLLVLVCGLAPWWAVLVVLAVYYISLILNALVVRRANIKYSPSLPVMFTLGVLFVYLLCANWPWWVWLLLILFYVLTLTAYYLMVVKMDEKNRNYWWLVPLFLTILTIGLLMTLRLCQSGEVIN